MSPRLEPALLVLRSFWRWWTSELAAMLPPSLRIRRAAPVRTSIRILRDAVELDRIDGVTGVRHRDERPIESLDDLAWTELGEIITGTRSELLLIDDAWTTRLTLPDAARSRLESAVALRLHELAPVDPAHLIWAVEGRRSPEGATDAIVAMARRVRIDHLRALFDAHEIPCPPVVVRDAGDVTIALAGGHDDSRSPKARADIRAILLATALVTSIPLTMSAAAAILAANNERASDALDQSLAPALARAQAWNRDEARRRALRPVLALPTASSVIEAVAQGLPADASLVSIAQPERHVLRIGVEHGDDDANVLGKALGKAPPMTRARITDVALVDVRPGEGGHMVSTFAAITP